LQPYIYLVPFSYKILTVSVCC